MQPYEPFVTTARSLEQDQSQRHAAFAQLVYHFRGMALTYAYQVLGDSQLAQDATQEAFLAAYQRLDQLRDPAAFPSWLRRIVHTHCHRVTRTKRLDTMPIEYLDATPEPKEDLAQLIADEDAAQALVDCVLQAVAALPDHEQIVVRLFYLDGKSIREVAHALGLPVTTIKKRLQYARTRLRKQLRETFVQSQMTMQGWVLQVMQSAVSLFLPLFLPLFVVAADQPFLCLALSSVRTMPPRRGR